ncbi:hypothetical protein J7E45_08320 [Microbacterium sp. ISL-59]|uniref:Qat anti-phage system QueC-like protein QatC n=1 Tax=Microbacterium sp. ISL-59 TaxID=2819159 RepID=UPI001BEAD719|nr:Qat anti-phage system QueC-like protein QatC [Microbacterium sp. ISL-59]MBT2495610.1 hypothetical protein [Microbacterium sp. ISL-59]
MKYVSGPGASLGSIDSSATPISLYEQITSTTHLTAGWAAAETIRRQRLQPDDAAWDLLTIALTVVAADGDHPRATSPDGWTREFELDIALQDPARWAPHADTIAQALSFLTTDRWRLIFRDGGRVPEVPSKPRFPGADSVALLSGGLDSLIGAIDLADQGRSIFAISQTVRGDAEKQDLFAKTIGGGLQHLQLNHNASTPRDSKETSQRSRSLIFLAFAVLGATSTLAYQYQQTIPLFICENGFIAVNPPLTLARIGSLSTRTAHPEFLARIQSVLDAVGLRVLIQNPYEEKTKGEMLVECSDQSLLAQLAPASTSCGRFQRFNYRHCGRCVPCQIRRASMLHWGTTDTTDYVFDDLGKQDPDHAAFDDVRSVTLAQLAIEEDGLDYWLGTALSSPMIRDRQALRAMIERGMAELRALQTRYGLL